MKPVTQLTLLAALTASLLSACGSSGSKAPEAIPAPPPAAEKDKQPEVQPKPQPENDKQPEVQPKPQPENDKQPEVQPKPQPENDKQPEVQPKPQPENDKQPEVQPKPQPENDKQPEVQPKPEMPEPPAPRSKFDDKQVIERLELNTKDGLFLDGLLKMRLNDGTRKIEFDIVPPHTFNGSPRVETLRDIDGTLVGYYAYARINQLVKDAYGRQDENGLDDRHLFLQYADSHNQKRPEATGNIQYRGTMLYQFNNNPNGYEEAKVSATYYGAEKALSMSITSDKDGAWALVKDYKPKSDNFVDVNTDGSVHGRLIFTGNADSTIIPAGEFKGGFYGKNGSVLAGEAGFEDKDNGWQGVIGAVAEQGK